MARSISKGALIRAAAAATLVYGMIAALAGTIVPRLSRELNLTPEQIGNLFLAQAIGMTLASISAGPLVDNKGKKTGMLLALILIAIALAGLPNCTGHLMILCCMTLLGLGGGILVTSSNALVSDISPERRASILTFLKCFFGVGGLLTPFIGANLLQGNTIVLCYVILVLAVATVLTVALTAMPPPSGERRFKLSEATRLVNRPLLYLLSFMLFLYVACEVGTFNWLAKHLIAQGLPESSALNVLSLGFAMGLLIGRLIFAGILMKVAAPTVTLLASAAMAVATFAILQTADPATAGVLAFAAGVAMAPVFPGVLAMVGDSFPRMTATAMGIVITSGWLGLAVSSRLIGAIAGDQPGGIKSGLLVLPVFSVLMIFVNLAVRPMLGKQPAIEAQPEPESGMAPKAAGRSL